MGCRSSASARPVSVLLVHNAYQQPGGEDAVFAGEAELLASRGHRVQRHEAHNDAVATMGRAALAGRTLWNHAAYRELRATIRRGRPGVVHIHNAFPLVSPAGYHAAAAEDVPVVQTLHNYRLLCPNGLSFRDGGPCEDCLGKALPWPGVAPDLARQVGRLLADPARLARIRDEARREYEANYTAERNYRMLTDVYVRAIERRAA